MHPHTLEQMSKQMSEIDIGHRFKSNSISGGRETAVPIPSPIDKPGRTGRRELGNRGYVKKMRNIPFLGIVCAILYAFFMSSSVALLRTVSIHPITVLIYRSIIQGGVFILITIYNQKSFFGVAGERWPVSGRAVFGMLNQLTWYISIKYISLTDSSAIYYSAPVYVSVLAFALLGEPFGVIELTSVLVTLVGVTLISKPGFLPFFRQDTLADVSAFNVSTGAPTLTNEGRSNGLIRIHNQTSTQFLISALNSTSLSSDNYTMTTLPVALSANETSIVDTSDVMVFGVSGHVIGMSLAFGGALTFAFTNICLRKMRKTPTEVTATWFSVFTIVSCVPLAIYMEVLRLPVNTIEWIVVILVGVFSTLGQVAFTLALKIEKAGPVSVAQTLNIVIVLFYQVVFFHEPVTTTSLAGVMLIIGSVLLIGLKDTFMQQRLMVRVIKRIRRQGQFDLHSPNGTCRKDSTLHSVKAGDSLPAKPSFCTCYTLPNKDTETAAVTDTPASLPVSHLQVPSSLTVDSEMDPELKAKLQRKLEH